MVQLPSTDRTNGPLARWRAHDCEITSLSVSLQPPSLISMDVTGETKVWSTWGELWASAHGNTTEVWPPPQISGLQQLLLSEARLTADALNMKRREQTPTQEMTKKMRKVKQSKHGKTFLTATSMGKEKEKEEMSELRTETPLPERMFSPFDDTYYFTQARPSASTLAATEDRATPDDRASPEDDEEFDDQKQMAHSASVNAIEVKKKRSIDPELMTKLCKHHVFSNLHNHVDKKTPLKQDPVERILKMHPIDRRAFPPISTQGAMEASQRKQRLSRVTSAPSLIAQATMQSESMKQYVEKAYNVDITQFSYRTIKRPSFARSQLDIGRVTPFRSSSSLNFGS